jgi:hypothetical protein
MRRISHKVPAMIFCLITAGKLLQAQALYPVPFAEKVKQASLIAEGIVEGRESFWNDAHTMILTANKVKVYKVFVGSIAGDYIEVLTQGGTVGNMSVEASDLLTLEKGDVGMFFCSANELKLAAPAAKAVLFDVYASAQGCYKYNLSKLSASAPLDNFSSITGGLYPAITSRTAGSFIDKQPGISFDKLPATTDVTQHAIISFSPQVVNAGALLQPDSNLLTITGTGFGAATGPAAVLFDDANDGTGGTPFVVLSINSLISSWTDTEIKVRVPTKAGTGNFSVRTAGGTSYPSATPLEVNYSVITAVFSGDNILQSVLMSTNNLGGYDILYSTSTAGNGRNLSTAVEKETFQRALTTWKEVCGANIREAGNTTNQKISSSDALNTIVLDNLNTEVPVLAAGVLAVTYSYNSACTSGGDQFIYPSQKTGFDILIRNTGVSTGNTNLTVGPCPPATNVVQSDLETVILHELGHAINLAHINDSYEGTQLPYVNPSKLMNYSIVNGVKRSSPDYSAKTGADYCVRKKGLEYGDCGLFSNEMQPTAATREPKDECPFSFPANTTFNNTQLTFDLVHATSNKYVDPQYTAVTCNGLGTGVTNTAFSAIKTNNAGTLTITVSGYATTPASQANCTVAGVELSLYKVNSCPEGQSFPAPVACRVFNGSGVLSGISGLTANSSYLLMADGIGNTKANFTLTLNGTVLPIKIKLFDGNISGSSNLVYWEFEALTNISQVTLERSTNGQSFTALNTWNASDFALKGNYSDKDAPVTGYYRLKFVGRDGNEEYSNIINLNHGASQRWHMYPNPAKETISLYSPNVTAGKYTAEVYASSGILVARQVADVAAASQRIQINTTKLASGNYKVVVTNAGGEKMYVGSVSIIK